MRGAAKHHATPIDVKTLGHVQSDARGEYRLSIGERARVRGLERQVVVVTSDRWHIRSCQWRCRLMTTTS